MYAYIKLNLSKSTVQENSMVKIVLLVLKITTVKDGGRFFSGVLGGL